MSAPRYFTTDQRPLTAPGEPRLDINIIFWGALVIVHSDAKIQTVDTPSFPGSSQNFLLPNYRRFQLMRFSAEEINNSSDLLPDVSLGYEIFDICSDLQSFPGILKQLSIDGSVQAWAGSRSSLSKVVGVVGPFSSTQALTAAPLFMVDFISMVNVLIAVRIPVTSGFCE